MLKAPPPFTIAARPRRPWQFRLKTLFVVLTLAAVALAWPTRLAYRQRKAIEFIRSVGGSVEYRQTDGAVAEGVRRWLGRDFVDDVSTIFPSRAPISDEDLLRLKPLSSVQTLALSHTRLTSASVGELSRFHKLAWLDVRFTQFDEQGFADLKRALPRAKVLCMNDTE